MPRGIPRTSPSMDAMALREMAKIMDYVHMARLDPDNMDFLASRIMSIASDRRNARQQIAATKVTKP